MYDYLTSNQFDHFEPAPRQVHPMCYQALYTAALRLYDLNRNAAHIGLYVDAAAYAHGAVEVLRSFEPPLDKRLQYLTLLAEASHTLVQRLFSAGRRNEALRPAEDTVQIYRQLATVSGANVPLIGAYLLTLSSNVATYFLAEAVRPAQAAVEVLRGYVPATGEQMAYLKVFAEALYTHAFRLKMVGRNAEAIPPARESVQVYRRLVAMDPAQFGPYLQTAERLLASLTQG